METQTCDKYGTPLVPGDTVMYGTRSSGLRFMVFVGMQEVTRWGRIVPCSTFKTCCGTNKTYDYDSEDKTILVRPVHKTEMNLNSCVKVPVDFVPEHIRTVLVDGQVGTATDIYDYWKRY